MRGFVATAAREQMAQETSEQGSLHRKPKKCTSCNVEKPASEFDRQWKSRDGLQYFCRPCKVIEAKALGLKAPLIIPTVAEARCTRCKLLKPAAKFYRMSRANGLRPWCKACVGEYTKQWLEKIRMLPPDRSADIEIKRCGRCHTKKRPEEFARSNSTLDGLRNYCHQCSRELTILSRQRVPAILQPRDTEVCTKCGKEVPSSKFSAGKGSPTGLQSWCKDCRSQSNLRRRKSTMQPSSHSAPLQTEKASHGLLPKPEDEE
ncbi:hypothetical protein COCOBI_04-7810 [Coccomyxa sp. Obi]|nr:hypothetical protein COCOBI_04-7810 [Coccomyxa sp. Obi]